MTSSEYTRREINHLRLVNHPIQRLHKCLMRRVRPHIVLPIGLVLKLNHKDMRNAILRPSVRPYNYVTRNTHLQSLDRVVLSPGGSLDVRFLRRGVDAILPEIEHAGTCLEGSVSALEVVVVRDIRL